MAMGCEALGLKATIVTTTTHNGETKTTVREARNWEEFKTAMGEVATDFSTFAKDVGATTAELAKALTEAPPQGQVKLGDLAPSLKEFEGDIRFDYLKVASMTPDAEYDFRYVQVGIPEYDGFFRASAELYATLYQLIETGRHMHLAVAAAEGREAPEDVDSGDKEIRRTEVEAGKASVQTAGEEGAQLVALWGTMAELGVAASARATEVAQTGSALVASAPTQIVNPKLVAHLDLIVKGLSQSVDLVKDSGGLLGKIVAS